MRELLSLECTLGEHDDIKIREVSSTRKFSSGSYEYLYNLVNNPILFELKCSKITRSVK